MAVRPVRPRSDRGSLKDIKSQSEEAQEFPYELKVSTLEPTPSELRIQKLYEFGKQNNDENLIAASGVITTDYIGDKNALPLSVYRIRKIVDDIKAKAGAEIDKLSEELVRCLWPLEISAEAKAYWDTKFALKKTASAKKPPIFRRVSKT